MSDLPRYELVPSHDVDVKQASGARPGDEESGWLSQTGTSSSSTAVPSRICYSFKPDYPVPGKEEDVVGLRGANKQVSFGLDDVSPIPFVLWSDYSLMSCNCSTPSPS